MKKLFALVLCLVLALGCTVGTLLSGIMAAAVSGWVFLLCAGLGLLLGWRLRWQPWRRTNA